MGIHISNQETFFSLETKNTTYQMKVGPYQILLHTWYGAKVEGQDMSYLLSSQDVGFSGNPYDAERDRTFSLDTLPQEYTTDGVGDYRINSISIEQEDGSCALDLRYVGYKVIAGKYNIEGMPALYANDDTEAETLEIYLKDKVLGIKVTLKYGVFAELDVITRSVVIENTGEGNVYLKKAASFCLDISQGDWEWMHFHGRHTMERIPERSPLHHGVQEIGSIRGTSSHQHNPALILCEPNCTEEQGSCTGVAFVYSGNFLAEIEKSQLDQVRFVMGIHPKNFKWTLNPKESFSTPEVVLIHSEDGLGALSQRFHQVFRENLCRGTYKNVVRPVLLNNWEATYFDFNEKKLLQIAQGAKELGVDMLVMDDGWFGKRDDDCSGLGDWFVNEEKLQGGLGKLVEQVNALGMKFGIWFEPEMISEDSDLYREHPEWAIQIPNRKPNRSRSQLVLDMTREDVQDYLFERIEAILNSAHIEYVKWDMNRSVCDWYSHHLSKERQGEMAHRYVLGLYQLLERVNQQFPHVLLEGCSGGGGRFDAGMLYYSPQIWCSDDTDAYERVKIQYGTSFFYPVSSVGSHVSAVPNHQTGRITSLDTRAVVAMAGTFGYELDLNQLTKQEKEIVKEQIVTYKKHAQLIQEGTYYRLSNPLKDPFGGWSYVSQNKKQVLVHGVIFRTEPNHRPYRMVLQGLDASALYTLEENGEQYTGKALMTGGLLLPQGGGDYVPVFLYLYCCI